MKKAWTMLLAMLPSMCAQPVPAHTVETVVVGSFAASMYYLPEWIDLMIAFGKLLH